MTFKVFKIGLRQIVRDGILVLILPAPILIGFLSKLGIPILNNILIEHFSFSLMPWYNLIDCALITLTPMFICLISAFLLLDERDEGIGLYYEITPIEGYSYLLSRIGMPMGFSFIYSFLICLIFKISNISMVQIIESSIINILMATSLTMLMVSLASNKLEGLAISKIVSLTLFAIFIPWFIKEPYQYLFAFLPSFWAGKIMVDGAGIIVFGIGLIICLVWIFILFRIFIKKY